MTEKKGLQQSILPQQIYLDNTGEDFHLQMMCSLQEILHELYRFGLFDIKKTRDFTDILARSW